MSAAGVLIALAVLLAAAAVYEAGDAWRRQDTGIGRGLSRFNWWPRRLRRAGRNEHRTPLFLSRVATTSRLARAGASDSLDVGAINLARLCGAMLALGPALVIARAMLSGRAVWLVALALLASAALSPDLVLMQMAKRRRQRILAALPDAIEVLATGAGGGRSVRAGIRHLARDGRGPLARELEVISAELECGLMPRESFAALRSRVPGPELAALTMAIERSARLGSPLVEHLHRQAGSLRAGRRRQLAEHAARAAPKMQLVIALILVPSVLLIIAAGLVANSGSLLAGY